MEELDRPSESKVKQEEEIALNKKLFIFLDEKGEPNYELLDKLRELSDELEKRFESYIALAPVGSRSRGYQKLDSDIDIRFLIDNSVEDARNCKSFVGTKLPVVFGEDQGIELHAMTSSFSPESLRRSMVHDEDASGYISLFSKLLVGSRIEEYRQILRDALYTLPEQTQKIYKSLAVAELVKFDLHSLAKINERNISEVSRTEFIKTRRKLWTARINNLWS